MPNLIPNSSITITILFEDESIIAIDKPAGIPVHPLKSDQNQSIANGLAHHNPALDGIGQPLEAGIVHRLDNDTSGVLIAAKTPEIYERLRQTWNGQSVLKEYTALVVGVLPAHRVITSRVAHHPSNTRKMVVSDEGREAQTEFWRTKLYRQGGEYSLASVQIKTGVRHQIRVHLASLGFPIVGDKLYQNPAKRKEDRLKAPRHFLHLSRVELPHPMSGKPIEIRSPLPKDLQLILPSASS